MATAWTAPKTWGAATLPSSEMNTYVRDNTTHLKERANVITYTPTIANVDTTTSETTFCSFSVPANDMEDGDMIEVVVVADTLQNTGVSQAASIDLAWGATEGDLIAHSGINTNAQVGIRPWRFWLLRSGSDIEAAASLEVNLATDIWEPVHGMTLASPTFTSTQTVALKMTLGASSASFYYRPQAAFVNHFKAP